MISIEFENIEKVHNELSRIIDNYSRSLDRKMSVIARKIVESIKENIISSVDVRGKRLMQNAPYTVKLKGFNWPLVQTGKMARGITYRAIPDGYEVYLAEKSQIGYKLNYGYSFRTNRGRLINVPQREFFGISNKLRREIKELLNKKDG